MVYFAMQKVLSLIRIRSILSGGGSVFIEASLISQIFLCHDSKKWDIIKVLAVTSTYFLTNL